MDLTTYELPSIEDSELNTFGTPILDGSISFYDKTRALIDSSELNKLNDQIAHIVQELYITNKSIAESERATETARIAYERSYRRVYLSLEHVKPESSRKERAKLEVEDMEDDVLYNSSIVKELQGIANHLRFELKSLEVISNNVRREMQVV